MKDLRTMMALFERLGAAIDTQKEPEILRTIYGRMRVASAEALLLRDEEDEEQVV